MRKFVYILIIIFVYWCAPVRISAQIHQVGGIGSVSLSKDIGRITEIGIEQEFRFDQNFTAFDRSLTSVNVNFSLFRKLLKIAADYDFICRNENTFYDYRHRASIGLTAHKKYMNFDFKLRTRGQAIYRDENKGDYKFNPKYVWRNKLECEYTIFGSPLKPFIAAEIFCPLNSKNGFFMDAYRLSLGAKYRLSYRQTIDFQLRYDQDIQQKNPENALFFGAGWNYAL